MNTKIFIGIIVLLAIVAAIYFFMKPVHTSHAADEQVAVQCGTKTVYRYKYPSEFFPTTISNYSSSASVATGILDKLIANTSGSSSAAIAVKDSAIQLREKLNQDNIFFENNLKAFFLLSNDRPCDDSLNYIYAAYIRDMSDKIIQLKQFVQQVSTPASSTASADVTNTDSILAVVDTASKQVDAGTTNINPANNNQFIVVKNYSKLNSAIGKLQTNYTKEPKINPSIIKSRQLPNN